MKDTGIKEDKKNIAVLCYNAAEQVNQNDNSLPYPVTFIHGKIQHREYLQWLETCKSDTVVLIDLDRIAISAISNIINQYSKAENSSEVYYISDQKIKLFLGTFEKTLSSTSEAITNAAVFVGSKVLLEKAYAGYDLAENPLVAIGYSLQKNNVRFKALENVPIPRSLDKRKNVLGLVLRYMLKVPFYYLFFGTFFKDLFSGKGKVQKDMVGRMLMVVFALFCYFYIPFVSQDYGISADEFIDNQQANNVINYFTNGDKAALNQPKTLLHFYGSGVQVVVTAVADFLHIENVYTFRHLACSLIGAWGIWIIGLLGFRFGGGLCGILSMLMLFFTPRYFGHAINNLKDAPFAVGYLAAVYYFIKLFDNYPYFKLHYALGAVTGIFLAFGTRAGGLMLYPYLVMYGGLFYILKVGWGEFYKFVKHKNDFLQILSCVLFVLAVGYFVSVLLWPFALQSPFKNVLFALQQFTNIGVGIKTMFDGQQVMSNMLPATYAPKYLMIGVPIISVIGFCGYLLYTVLRPKKFDLITFFLLFYALFPVFWVVYKKSNLYGGIRHMLFIMPVMVVIAGKFWTILIENCQRYFGAIVFVVWIGLLTLPAIHMIRNHPNDYIYFNEFVGGLKGVYGDYDTDYFFNSLKNSSDWFRKNIKLPTDKKTIILTNHYASLGVYFKADTNVKIVYSRYYEKYSKDWDYAIWGNMYIDRFQLKNGLFPPKGTIYSSLVDGLPMSVVVKRENKDELQGFQLEKEGKIPEALSVFQEVIKQQPENEEILSRMSKLSYMSGNPGQAELYAESALKYHPRLNEALYMLALADIQQKKYKEAMSAAQGLLDQNAFSVDGYYLKAVIYKEEKKYNEAVNNLNKALAYRPEFDRALALAGEILMINQNYESAVQVYNRLLKVANNVQTMTMLADCYCRLKNYEQVQKLLGVVNQAQPDYWPAYKVMLRMAIQKNDLKNAENLLRSLVNVNNDAELFVLRALYFKEIGEADKAHAMIESALLLNPDHIEAKNFK